MRAQFQTDRNKVLSALNECGIEHRNALVSAIGALVQWDIIEAATPHT